MRLVESFGNCGECDSAAGLCAESFVGGVSHSVYVSVSSSGVFCVPESRYAVGFPRQWPAVHGNVLLRVVRSMWFGLEI